MAGAGATLPTGAPGPAGPVAPAGALVFDVAFTPSMRATLATTFVKPPSITQLALELGISPPPLNVDEAVAMLQERLAV